MSLFDLVINIIESSIMCYFIYKYFDFKQIEKLWLFILIDFTSITLCNSFINESSALLIIVTSVLIVCLKMFGEKIRIESIIVCFLSLIIDIVCNVVSLIIGRIANYFIGTQFIQMPAMTVLSKILYLIAVLAFLKKKASYKSQLNSKRWLTLIIVISILFIVAYILVTSYVFDNVDTLVNLFCTALIFIAIILIIVFGRPLFYDSILDDGFRYSESSFSIKEDARSHIWSEAWDFIQSTPVGGIFYYTNTHIKMPHNFFLNAFIYGGIFGGLFLITLFVEQMIIVLKILIQKLSANNILSLVFAGAYLAYSINTMTHNSSLADGNLLVWLLWGAIISTRNGINNIKK